MITHPYWLKPLPVEGFATFRDYLTAVFERAPAEALTELRVSLALEADRPVLQQLPFHVTRELAPGDAPRQVVPQRFFANAVAPVLVSCLLRNLVVASGAGGLAATALYRPVGGAKRSMHKKAAAFDTRLLDADKERLKLQQALACAAAWVYHNGAALRVSVGTYRKGDRANTVHIDCGRKYRRCWTYAGSFMPVWFGDTHDGGPEPGQHLDAYAHKHPVPTPVRPLEQPWLLHRA